MIEKLGKFYADWRDATGTRKRKAFRTKHAAKIYQAKMQRAARSKKAKARAA
jgi:hypothetical protein